MARNLNALVSGKVKEQSPQVDAINPIELGKPFLGGAIKERPHLSSINRSLVEECDRNHTSWH